MSQNILFQQDQSYHFKNVKQHLFGTFEDLHSKSCQKKQRKVVKTSHHKAKFELFLIQELWYIKYCIYSLFYPMRILQQFHYQKRFLENLREIATGIVTFMRRNHSQTP